MQVLRVDAAYRGVFREPVFPFVANNFSPVFEAIFRRFSPWVRADEIRWEGFQPSDFQAVCNLLYRSASIRFKATEVEAWTSATELLSEEAVWKDLVLRSALVPKDLQAGMAYLSHSFIVASHWKVPESSTFDRYVSRWDGPRPSGFATSGISFLSTREGPSVTIEFQPSLLYGTRNPENGFVRLTCEVPGETDVTDACTSAQFAIRETLERFDLDLGIT